MKFRVVTILMLSFGGLVLVSALALLAFALQQAVENAELALSHEVEKLLREAEQESRLFYGLAEEEGRWFASEVSAGRLYLDGKPENRAAIQHVLAGALSTLPQVEAVTFQKPDGNGIYYDRETGILQEVFWRPSWRVNRRGVGENGVWVFRPSALDGSHRGTFITSARDEEGTLLGSFGIRIDPSLLSARLSKDADFRGFPLTRFLLFNNRAVVAHPSLADAGPNERPTLASIQDSYLMALPEAERKTPRLLAPINKADVFVTVSEEQGDRVFALMQDAYRQTGGQVTIGVHFDEAAGAAEVQRLYSSIVVGAALVLISLSVALFLGLRAARPIRDLAHAAKFIEAGDLDHAPVLKGGATIELDEAARAFNGMVEGLRERAKIRDLFGKYVPENVARLLISDEGAAAPRQGVASVLFSDLAGFTAMSETMSPAEVVDTMNAFFSRAVEIIEAHQGIVAQFQGDAVVAVFNTPIADPDHAHHAVKAARRLAEAVASEQFHGHRLKIRIGVNTGPVVSGAVGASNRLSYTVHGDAVNLAARLEQMNKETGTTILVSEETQRLVAETHPHVAETRCREIGVMPVRGRAAAVTVFTLNDRSAQPEC